MSDSELHKTLFKFGLTDPNTFSFLVELRAGNRQPLQDGRCLGFSLTQIRQFVRANRLLFGCIHLSLGLITYA